MKRQTIRIGIFVVSFWLSASSAMAHSMIETLHDQKAKLDTIVDSIFSLKHSLSKDQWQRTQLEHQLSNTEIQIGDTTKKLNVTQQQLQSNQVTLVKLQGQHADALTRLTEQKKLLAEQLRIAYMLGREENLKILLNQESPATIDRFLVYSKALLQARAQGIVQVQQSVQQVETLSKTITQQTQQLEDLKSQQESQQMALKHQNYLRDQVLQKVDASIGSKKETLQKLMQDKANLQAILEHLSKKHYSPPAGAQFPQMLKQIAGPVPGGRIIQRFGQPLLGGRMYSSGITISAPMGTPIHAVSSGKVVFSNWLRGYGLLVIIQHSQTYMTLYAHDESLYVKEGDIVHAGDVIATVGNSGGLMTPALYFEVTSNGQGIDPLKWLQKNS